MVRYGLHAMPLHLSFLSQPIRDLCERRAAAEYALGRQAARHLRARLSDICAAEKISDVVAGRPKTMQTQVVISLFPPHKMVLEPAMTELPTKNDGATDWDAIDHFRVIEVN